MSEKIHNVLLLCTGNSARSLMVNASKGAIVAALAGTTASDVSTLTIRRDGDVPYTLAVSAEPAGDFALVRVDQFEKERPLP